VDDINAETAKIQNHTGAEKQEKQPHPGVPDMGQNPSRGFQACVFDKTNDDGAKNHEEHHHHDEGADSRAKGERLPCSQESVCMQQAVEQRE
jgi:hypothetical protein